MIVGVPKEIKDHEYRVAATPAGVDLLAGEACPVLVESGAGEGSGIADEDYVRAGAEIVSRDEVFRRAELIVKVKEPQPEEYALLSPGQTLFTFFHFAASRDLTQAMVESGVTCIAYETVQTDDGSLPLLAPMSDVAGRVAMSAAIKYLERPMGGKGKLISGIPGVRPGKVIVLGGGIAGSAAARIAAGLGAEVYLLDVDLRRLRFLFETCAPNVHPLVSNPHTIRDVIRTADVIIGAVLKPGGRTPILVTEAMLDTMEPGSVIIDIAVDQGGCVETARPTTHSRPTYIERGMVHYCVTNMPGAVAHTSTYGLTNATIPFVVELAKRGWRQAAQENPALARGVNISEGRIRHAAVAEAFGKASSRWRPVETRAEDIRVSPNCGRAMLAMTEMRGFVLARFLTLVIKFRGLPQGHRYPGVPRPGCLDRDRGLILPWILRRHPNV
jgi:alanine dehydrogenase